jgi:hypothetical protein
MKKVLISPQLKLYTEGQGRWVLTQMQAAAGKLQEVFAASDRRPNAAKELGVLTVIEDAISSDSGDVVNPMDHEVVAALIQGPI